MFKNHSLILTILATQKTGLVLSTLVVKSNFGAVYSVRWLSNQILEPCTQYVGCQIKFWSRVLSTLVVNPNFGVVYSIRWSLNQFLEPCTQYTGHPG